jgi:hypothetical protein
VVCHSASKTLKTFSNTSKRVACQEKIELSSRPLRLPPGRITLQTPTKDTNPDERDKCLSQIIFLQKKQENDL